MVIRKLLQFCKEPILQRVRTPDPLKYWFLVLRATRLMSWSCYNTEDAGFTRVEIVDHECIAHDMSRHSCNVTLRVMKKGMELCHSRWGEPFVILLEGTLGKEWEGINNKITVDRSIWVGSLGNMPGREREFLGIDMVKNNVHNASILNIEKNVKLLYWSFSILVII